MTECQITAMCDFKATRSRYGNWSTRSASVLNPHKIRQFPRWAYRPDTRNFHDRGRYWRRSDRPVDLIPQNFCKIVLNSAPVVLGWRSHPTERAMLAKRWTEDWRILPRAVYDGSHDKPETYRDGIFFNKSDIKTGSRIIHYGRRASKTTWIIYDIWTFTGSGRDRVRSSVADVRTLDDRLDLRCEETGERRTMSFTYLVYSSLWRLPDEGDSE